MARKVACRVTIFAKITFAFLNRSVNSESERQGSVIFRCDFVLEKRAAS